MYLATQDKPFFSSDFEKKFEQIKALGFDGFEIDGKALLEKHTQIDTASKNTGLSVKMICGGYRGWIGDFDENKRQECINDITQMLEVAGTMQISGIVVPAAWGMFSLRLPPMTPPRSAEKDREVLFDSIEKLNAVCSKTGTNLYLEPLNRYENHMILLVEEAVSYIEEGNFSHVKVTADFFHMNIEENIIEKTLDLYKKYIGHIHIASSQRLQPGIGHLDYLPGFKILHANNYQGGISIECRVQAKNEMEAYRESVQFVRNKLALAGYSQ